MNAVEVIQECVEYRNRLLKLSPQVSDDELKVLIDEENKLHQKVLEALENVTIAESSSNERGPVLELQADVFVAILQRARVNGIIEC